jgi:hypothetical protein
MVPRKWQISMSSQADFASLEQLHLLHHGDAIERFYWPKVASHLSEYEVFWTRFVVLLTYRVDPSAISDWIMVRDNLPTEYEALLMANYSTFYHCAVAQEQIETGNRRRRAAASITLSCSSFPLKHASKISTSYKQKPASSWVVET